eukprot:1150011-Pelagomonas_calceolata.AAC.1
MPRITTISPPQQALSESRLILSTEGAQKRTGRLEKPLYGATSISGYLGACPPEGCSKNIPQCPRSDCGPGMEASSCFTAGRPFMRPRNSGVASSNIQKAIPGHCHVCYTEGHGALQPRRCQGDSMLCSSLQLIIPCFLVWQLTLQLTIECTLPSHCQHPQWRNKPGGIAVAGSSCNGSEIKEAPHRVLLSAYTLFGKQHEHHNNTITAVLTLVAFVFAAWKYGFDCWALTPGALGATHQRHGC